MENVNYVERVEFKYLGPTNTKGSRISLKFDGKRKVLAYDYTFDTSREQAIGYLIENGIPLLSGSNKELHVEVRYYSKLKKLFGKGV